MTATPREITLAPSRYGTDEWDSLMILRVHCRYTRRVERLGVLYVGPKGSCRRVYQGPVLPGPYAAPWPHATVIDNHGGTGAESALMQAAGLEFTAEPGDRFLIGGVLFELADDQRDDYPQLNVVTDS